MVFPEKLNLGKVAAAVTPKPLSGMKGIKGKAKGVPEDNPGWVTTPLAWFSNIIV